MATLIGTKAVVISWGGYWAVASYAKDGSMIVHASSFRSYESAAKSAARRNAKAS
jgi:hypothetical protein